MQSSLGLARSRKEELILWILTSWNTKVCDLRNSVCIMCWLIPSYEAISDTIWCIVPVVISTPEKKQAWHIAEVVTEWPSNQHMIPQQQSLSLLGWYKYC